MRIALLLTAHAVTRLGLAGWRHDVRTCGTAWAPRYRLQDPEVELSLEEVEKRRYFFDLVEAGGNAGGEASDAGEPVVEAFTGELEVDNASEHLVEAFAGARSGDE